MEKPKRSKAADWSNYWQGREAETSGEVFAGIETSQVLAAFWQEALADAGGCIVLDIACGAGSALKHAGAAEPALAIGLDISDAALRTAREALPSLAGIAAHGDRLPLADATVDRVISQFGFEYAGIAAPATEIARVLGPGGRFTAIAHMQGGAIARECRAHVDWLDVIAASGFVAAARRFFTVLFGLERGGARGGEAELRAAIEAFRAAQLAMAPAVAAGGIAAHLQAGTQQLYERRQGYALVDITGWLDGMEAEIAAYRGRMEGMLAAALSEADARAVVAALDPDGGGRVEPFELGGQPAAYRLEAVRSASSPADQRA